MDVNQDKNSIKGGVQIVIKLERIWEGGTLCESTNLLANSKWNKKLCAQGGFEPRTLRCKEVLYLTTRQKTEKCHIGGCKIFQWL